MEILLVRHGFLRPGDELRQKMDLDGPQLHSYGIMQARRVGGVLLQKLDRSQWESPEYAPVAVSEALCTQQTAQHAGFTKQQVYSQLNEIGPNDGEPAWDLTAARGIPETGLRAARALLEQPPEESMWFTHPLLMAAIYQVLEQPTPNQYRFTPDGCEVWPIVI